MLLINNETVEEVLDMAGCIDALEIGYRDPLAERAVYRPRIDLYVPQDFGSFIGYSYVIDWEEYQ